jgi:acyl-ACP thioesterase
MWADYKFLIKQRNIISWLYLLRRFYIIIKRVDALNNIKAVWLCINRNKAKEINFIKKFKNS